MLLVVLAGCAAPVDSLAPVTTQGQSIAQLYTLVLAISFLVFLLVAGLLLVIIVRFRSGAGERAPSERTGNRRLEIGWTAAALLLLGVLAIPAFRTMAAVDAPSDSGLRVEVIGHQWWWEYRYPDLGVVTANELHVPTGRPLRLELQAADVVHSFWVPRFGWKRDAVPGKANLLQVTVEEAGVFDGTCTEYCGLQHAWMRIRVVAEAPDRFDAWIAGQRQPAADPSSDPARRGMALFIGSTCVNCHTIRGTAAAGDVGPDLTHLGSRSIIGGGVLEMTPENLARFAHDAPAVKPGVLMPSFQGLSPQDVDSLTAYLQGLR